MKTSGPARWLLANVELDSLLARTPADRAAYLTSLREHDPGLAADVDVLLAEHDALDAAGLVTLASGGAAPRAGTGQDLDGDRSSVRADLAAGEVLGPYRIVRPLGRGGMGTVYQAEEVESGRHVALKVLRQRLDGPRARERFHREGRLAASLNDRHCVFVFGASEIDGQLAIAMELMQHTLDDRLKTGGPLAPSEAVDVTLQLIAGLRAAAAVGILHRDVKPSNCFVDGEGGVKIGDFGISRSLHLSDDVSASTQGRFAATPAYASPEQLRGDPLDIRADIYSLGATLYELLTAHTPFQHDDVMAMLMAVANDAPRPPHRLAAAVPRGLSRVVLRCLAKRPEERFADYDALAATLAPYSSTAPTPATLGARFAAGVIDQSVVASLSATAMVWWTGPVVSAGSTTLLGLALAWFVSQLVYYAIAEAAWARTPGKLLVGVRLADSQGRPPTAWATLSRAASFAAVWTAGGVVEVLLHDSDGYSSVFGMAVSALLSPASWVILAAVFSSARRSNGYASWHDLVTATRVVERAARVAGPVEPYALPATVPEAGGRVGPFHVANRVVPGLGAGWRQGFDDRLRRAVWIRDAPAGTEPLDPARMAVNRATRLRWLAGQRTPGAAWDAFEAVAGVPLREACAHPRPWAVVRWWLLELARECAAQTPEDQPPLRADRVWVLHRGGAKLIDDPIAGRAEPDVPRSDRSCAALLLDVVHAACGPGFTPWPLGAQRFVERLGAERPPEDAAIVDELEWLTRQRATLTRRWRAAHVLGLAAIPMLVVGGNAMLRAASDRALDSLPHDVHVAMLLLDEHRLAEQGIGDLSSEDVEAIEVVLTSRYRQVLRDPRLFTAEYAFAGRNMRSRIDRVLERTPSEVEAVRANEQPFVRLAVAAPAVIRSGPRAVMLEVRAAIIMFARAMGVVALLALVAAAAFRGGLIRAMGLDLVTAKGRPASRGRTLARTVVALGPILLILVGVRPGPTEFGASAAALLAMTVGAVLAILHPDRGIPDRLTGTWIVPR